VAGLAACAGKRAARLQGAAQRQRAAVQALQARGAVRLPQRLQAHVLVAQVQHADADLRGRPGPPAACGAARVGAAGAAAWLSSDRGQDERARRSRQKAGQVQRVQLASTFPHYLPHRHSATRARPLLPMQPKHALGQQRQRSRNDSGCAIRLKQVRGPARAALAERPMRQTYSECNPTCPYLLPALARTVLRRDRGELQRRWRTTAATGQRSRSACRGSAGLGERAHRSGHMARAPASGDNRGSVHFSPGGVAIPIPRDSTRARPRVPQEHRGERGSPPGERLGAPVTAGLCTRVAVPSKSVTAPRRHRA